MDPDYVKDDQTTEFAMVVKVLCETYDLNQKDICRLGQIFLVWDDETKVRYKRQISLKIPIPAYLAPKTEQYHYLHRQNFLDITISPNPSFDDPREFGLYELELKTDQKTIRFWKWRSYREFGPIGKNVTFVERKNIKTLYRHILKLQREVPDAKMPVLAKVKLEEIFKNSVGFLEKGTINAELYKTHNIPCKRGILLSGKPGCVTGDTIIRIRKKYEKGTHGIYASK